MKFFFFLNIEKNIFEQKKNFEKKNFEFTPVLPMSVHTLFQPIRSRRLAGQREHIYECLVLCQEATSQRLG